MDDKIKEREQELQATHHGPKGRSSSGECLGGTESGRNFTLPSTPTMQQDGGIGCERSFWACHGR
eukprot:5020378-Pleurochrysis_carterae.AAC.1